MQVTHGPAHDAAQNVTTPVPGRRYALGNQEGRASKMVRHDPMAHLKRTIRSLAGHLGTGKHQSPHHVDIVIVVLTLHHRHKSLEAHPGINRRMRERRPGARRTLLVLHEHQVPDLDETISVFIGRAGGATRDRRAVIVEDF